MQSVIFQFIDEDWQEKLSIGTIKYMKDRKKTCRQLVSYLWREHTDEQRRYLVDLPIQELYMTLIRAMENNAEKVFYPN